MKLFKNILYSILSIQEKFLRHQLSKTLGVKNSSKRKRHFYGGCSVDLSMLAENEKLQLESDINNILKKCDFEPDRILEYIKSQGTNVYFINNAANLLNPIGENEGFIYPSKGAKALYLSLAVNKKISLRTDEMFVLPKSSINKYYFIYHFYNWFAFKHNIAGLDEDSQRLLKKYLFETSDTRDLQLADIYKLKDAIRQDKAAIEFVIKLCRNVDGTKQALEKMEKEGSAKL